MFNRKVGVLALALAILATSAHAVTLTPAKYRGSVGGGVSYNGFSATSVSRTSLFGTKSASSTGANGGRAAVKGISTIAGDGVAEAFVTYKFAVLTPLPGFVDIIVNAAAESAGSGAYFGEAGVDIFGSRNTTAAYVHSCHASPGCNFTQVFTSGGPKPITIRANEVYTVQIYASGGTFDAGSSFDVWADPTFSFDPASVRPEGATFAFSEGVEGRFIDLDPPAGGVPEPASWALMVVGFGSLGAALRRRRAAIA